MDGLIYAYHVPRSSAQARYAQAQVAKALRERKSSAESLEHLERAPTKDSTHFAHSASSEKLHSPQVRDDVNAILADIARANAGYMNSETGNSQSEHAHNSSLHDPFELRHGRRYLRAQLYPLPCDLQEIQRQNLRTLLGCSVFGRPICSPRVAKQPPLKVLDMGCGSGYWSAICHDYFAGLGHDDVSFTGLDIAPLAPDLRKQGVNWTFVQHDFRRLPLPFDSDEFDLIMAKDTSMTMSPRRYQKVLDECMRLLRVGGTFEVWESDHVLRSLLPHPPSPPSKQREDQETAVRTGTFLMSPGTPFAPAQNKYLQHANTWIQEALDRQKLVPEPCARIAQVLYQETNMLNDVGIRRVAIPLGELRWERDSFKHSRSQSEADDLLSNKGKPQAGENTLTAEQAALRHTALLTVIQMIESLEPLLQEVSGKSSEEWSHWWALMMADLMDPNKGAINGECLEIGAWWATRIAEP